MIVADTNVLVRYLIKDDRAQAKKATEFMAKHRCLVLPSVLVEVVWVLSSSQGYALERTVVLERLLHLLGLPCVETREGAAIGQAIDWYRGGMDFADAIHLALSGDVSGLATFDKSFASKAKRLKAIPSVVLLL